MHRFQNFSVQYGKRLTISFPFMIQRVYQNQANLCTTIVQQIFIGNICRDHSTFGIPILFHIRQIFNLFIALSSYNSLDFQSVYPNSTKRTTSSQGLLHKNTISSENRIPTLSQEVYTKILLTLSLPEFFYKHEICYTYNKYLVLCNI